MSEPAIFVLIRDGQPRYFADRWASAFLFREILWGPDELERWLTEMEEIGGWTDEACGGVVVDYDNRKLVWHGEADMLGVPRVASAYQKLLAASWPGFEIEYVADGLGGLARAAGEPDADDYDDETPQRCSIVREAAGYDQDDEEDEQEGDEDDLGFEYDDDETRAWVTLIDPEGAVRHRNLSAVSEDLVHARDSAIQQLASLPAAEIPAESVVTEGMWIDQVKREVGFWGGPAAKVAMPQLKESWGQSPHQWTVVWANNGYADQCAVSGPSGIPMSDAEALGVLAPTILSTKRFDIATVFGAMGGQLKKTAIKATGCLLMFLCAPVLLFGAISGDWKAALITVAIVAACVVITFLVIERRLKKKFAIPELYGDHEDGEERAPVAGPIDEKQRRQRLEQLLRSAGLPPLSEIEPHFASDSIDDLL